MTNNLLTDIPGIAVGNVEDLSLGSGVTAIVFDKPAVAAVSVLGGAPGGRDTHMLAPENTVEAVDAIVLSGGSALGLDAAGGVQAWLREQGRGVRFRGILIPLVPQAIIFDLANGGNKDWGRFSPYRDMGFAAAAAARAAPFELGTKGAGAGATTATVKGGLGSASAITRSGHTVAAIVSVNAVGAPTIGDGPWFWAAPYERDGEFGGLGWPQTCDTTPPPQGYTRHQHDYWSHSDRRNADQAAGDATGDHGARRSGTRRIARACAAGWRHDVRRGDMRAPFARRPIRTDRVGACGNAGHGPGHRTRRL